MRKKKLEVLLSVSGGGILGVGPAHLLKRLEKDLGIDLYYSFKAFAGTSTGAIIAGAIDQGIPAEKIEKLYLDNGKDIFKKWSYWDKLNPKKKPLPEYDNSKLAELLKKLIPGKMSEFTKEIFIPAVNMISVTNPEKVFDKGDDVDKWWAILASTSAPTYFMPAGSDKSWIDGGLVVNNPIAVLQAGYVKRTGNRNFKILHLDTTMTVNKKGEGGNKTLVGWASYILKEFVARSEQSQTYIAKANLGDENVMVLSPKISKGYKMDDTSSKTLNEVIDIWDKYYDENKDSIIKFVTNGAN